MFQSFKSKSSSENSKVILASLRAVMKERSIDWLLVPHGDEHQNEYLPERCERLAFLTGFTGSAGYSIVGQSTAYLFVDGRYTVQAANQIDGDCFEIKDLVSENPAKFASSIFYNNDLVGFDPWLMTIGQHKTWQTTIDETGATLVATENLIDKVWKDQPAPPTGKAWLHPLQYAGRSASEKLASIRETLDEDGADFLLQTDPASLAWTFNIRGNDLVHNPLALGWAIIPTDPNAKPMLFIHREKFSADDLEEIEALAVIENPDELSTSLAKVSKKKKLHCDPNLVASHLGLLIEKAGGEIISKRDPVVILRAVKNEAELEGTRQAHIRDGVAMVHFLAWLDGQSAGSVDEIMAAQKLEDARRETAKEMGSELREISFDTISGAGANGAIVHYRVTEESNATLKDKSLYLVDSGGQYLDGTTDITRTIAIGTPPPQAVIDNTLVLKGHIAIARARFPAGTRGVDIDGLARMPLWQNGKDFAHGTGHGVGSYLNVHEGPQSISKRGMEPFKAGMIISNEPGFYKEDAYGIRIENLVIVTEEQDIDGGDKPMMSFETITLCPIDLRLIDRSFLTKTEINWLNAYHDEVRQALSPFIKGKTLDWLEQATKAL